MRRFGELIWVIGLVLFGIIFRSVSDDIELSFRYMLMLSLGITVFFFSKSVKTVYGAIKIKTHLNIVREVYTWVLKSGYGAFWIFALVFSSELVTAWFLPLPEGVAFTWKDTFKWENTTFLVAFLIIALKIAVVTKRAFKR